VLSLDDGLKSTRARLLDDISQPDLGTIRRRSAALRRRRRAGRAGSALLAMAVATTLLIHPWTRTRGGPDQQPAAPPSATPSPAFVFTERGVTVNGLTSTPTELPGDVRDAEFVDPDRGWVLAADCGKGAGACRLTLGSTEDGGYSWRVTPLNVGFTGPEVPDLVTLGPGTLVLHWPAGQSRMSTDGGATWRPVDAPTGPAPTTISVHDRLLLRRGGSGCVGSVVELWQPVRGNRGPVAKAPPLEVCWVATTRATDGGWWVGGTTPGGEAVAAVTYDGGASWQRRTFDGLSGSVRIGALGSDVFAAVVDNEGGLHAIYHSTDRGATFTHTWQGAGEPRALGGDLVPLLDRRLLLSDGSWWFVSNTYGATFLKPETLHTVGRIVRTPAGFVAYNIVANGFTAFSVDGGTWRKLHVH
jgi:hypothetical protein